MNKTHSVIQMSLSHSCSLLRPPAASVRVCSQNARVCAPAAHTDALSLSHSGENEVRMKACDCGPLATSRPNLPITHITKHQVTLSVRLMERLVIKSSSDLIHM